MKPDSTRNGKRRSFQSGIACFSHACRLFFLCCPFAIVSFACDLLYFSYACPVSVFFISLAFVCIGSFWRCFRLLGLASVSLRLCFDSLSLQSGFACAWLGFTLASPLTSFLLCFALLWLRLGCGLIWAFALALLGLLIFSLADFE